MTTAAFFDIGDTLGAVRVRPSGDGIDEIAVYPGVRDALAELRAGGVALGIISYAARSRPRTWRPRWSAPGCWSSSTRRSSSTAARTPR